MAGWVDDGEIAGSDEEADGLGGASGEMNALEADQGANGSTVNFGMRDVEFDDFVTGKF